MDIAARLKKNCNLNTFLEEYPKVTLNDPRLKLYIDIKNEIDALNSYLQLVKFDVKEHFHYGSCPWSKPDATVGPDTCLCSLIASGEYLINEKLADLYGKDVRGL